MIGASAAEEGDPPPVKLQHRPTGNKHQVGRHLGRPRNPPVGRLVVVISGDVVDLARERRHSWSGRAEIVSMEAEIADLNCNIHAGREAPRPPLRGGRTPDARRR